MGPEAPGARGRRAAGALGGARRRLLRQGVRHHLPRPAAHARPPSARTRSTASRSPRCSVSPRSACSPASCRASSSTRWRRWSSALVGGRMPVQRDVPWLSIVPIAESRSSYNGLLVFVFIAVSASLAAVRHPPLRLARAAARRRPGIAAFPIRARRRNTPPAASPSRSAASSARSSSAPARRSTCRRPARSAGAARRVELRDLDLGRALRADRAAPSHSSPSGSTVCSS